MSLFYSSPQGGRVGFFAILCESIDVVTWLNCFEFSRIFPPTFVQFPPPTLAHFLNVVYFFNMIRIFLWHINVFNVRQEYSLFYNVCQGGLILPHIHTYLLVWSLSSYDTLLPFLPGVKSFAIMHLKFNPMSSCYLTYSTHAKQKRILSFCYIFFLPKYDTLLLSFRPRNSFFGVM